MRFLTVASLASAVLAARPFLNEPETGLEEFTADFAAGELPPLSAVQSLPDFDHIAKNYLNGSSYAFYRNAAGGEYSYRNNLEIFPRIRFRPRMLNDVSKVGQTLSTKILGTNFSAPFFIAPATRGLYANERAELNLVEGAAAGGILYVAAMYASLSIEEIAAGKAKNQTTFQQIYAEANFTATLDNIKRAEKAGAKAIIFTIDAPATSTRPRAWRYNLGNRNANTGVLTWDTYAAIKKATKLPVIPKGITTVDDAKLAIKAGAPAIYLSNHGGRQLDGSPSPFEIALEIYQEAPEIFKQVEVWADSGVRYGTDVLKLLALGVKAVGLGRPFMYSSVYGTEGVKKLIEILKTEIVADAANLGVADLKKINTTFLNMKALQSGSWINGFSQ